MIDSITSLYIRDLDKLIEEIKKYKSEQDLWKIDGEILNPAGNLVLHITGNILHFIGAILGGTDYKRNREAEFNSKNVLMKDLIIELELTKKVVQETFSHLQPSKLKEEYPINVFGESMSTEFFIIHLYGHLNWHYGQINYHRRLLHSNLSSNS